MTMTCSMTGFGRGESCSEIGAFTVEVRSVNHRYLESRVHVPRQLGVLEGALTRMIKSRIRRGKVDASVKWQPAPRYGARVRFNQAMLQEYMIELEEMLAALGRETSLPVPYLLDLPGVSETEEPAIDEAELLSLAGEALVAALENLNREREREGAELRKDILTRIETLKQQRLSILEQRETAAEKWREKMRAKAEQWASAEGVQIEPGRLEQEVLLLVERSDITEELVRLEAHFTAFEEAFVSSDAPSLGKALEFLTQELLRETNTIASKSRDSAIAGAVLTMKGEIEKIREQVLNLE